MKRILYQFLKCLYHCTHLPIMYELQLLQISLFKCGIPLSVKQYLIFALLYIFLTTSNSEHFSMSLLTISIFSFAKKIFKSFASFFHFVSKLQKCLIDLHLMYFFKHFLTIGVLPVRLLKVSFDEQYVLFCQSLLCQFLFYRQHFLGNIFAFPQTMKSCLQRQELFHHIFPL